MCEELRLERFDDTPWGFRLTGGLDFGTPLTVIKVTGGSIAEHGGVQVGDIVVEINGLPTKHVTHLDAQNYIGSSKGILNLTVMRGSLVTPPDITPLRGMTPMVDSERGSTPMSLNVNALKEKLKNVINEEESITSEDEERVYGPAEVHQKHGSFAEVTNSSIVNSSMSEMELAELLTGNEEVLDQGVLGINFQKFLPQVDFIRQSEVFKFLQNENVHKEIPEQVQLEKEPTKRFSTFLMKPKAPPGKPSGPLWIHPKAPNYLPRDSKKDSEAPKRRVVPPKEDPGHTVLWLFLAETGDEVVDERWGNDEEERINLSRNSESRITTPCGSTASDKTDSKPKQSDETSTENSSERQNNVQNECISETTQIIEGTESKKESEEQIKEEQPKTVDIVVSRTDKMLLPKKTSVREEEEAKFTKRLTDIKQQIAFLEEQAPEDLQTQLDAIHIQLEKIVKLKSIEAKKYEEIYEEIIEEETEQVVEREYVLEEADEDEYSNFDDQETHETNFDRTDTEDNNEDKVEIREVTGKEIDEGIVAYEKGEYEVCTAPPPPKKTPALPLTPQTRPIVLPGGRMWRQPKDAAHDEFYTGVLVAQAEVLVGSNVGVNFTKYVPPKFDMSHSDVYRLIHEIEDKTRKNSKVENEYYHTPIDKRHFYAATLRGPSPIGNVELTDL